MGTSENTASHRDVTQLTLRCDEKAIAPGAPCQDIFQHFTVGGQDFHKVSGFRPLPGVVHLNAGHKGAAWAPQYRKVEKLTAIVPGGDPAQQLS